MQRRDYATSMTRARNHAPSQQSTKQETHNKRDKSENASLCFARMNIDHQVYSETANPVPTLSKTKRGQKSGEAEQPIIGKSVFAILFVITSERKLNKTLGEKAQDIHEYDYEDTHANPSCCITT